MIKCFKFRLYPSKEQAETLHRWGKSNHLLYNLILDHCKYNTTLNSSEFKEKYGEYEKPTRKKVKKKNNKVKEVTYSIFQGEKLYKKYFNIYSVKRELKDLRKEIDFFREVPSLSQQEVFRNFDKAIKNFLSGQGRYPAYKKRDSQVSVSIPMSQAKILDHNNYWKWAIRFPNLSPIPFYYDRDMEGKPTSVTLKKFADKWFVTFTCHGDKEEPQVILENKRQNKEQKYDPQSIIAVDRGVHTPYSLSNGKQYWLPPEIKALDQDIKWISRKMAKKVEMAKAEGKQGKEKYSKNRNKLSVKLARKYLRQKWLRENFNRTRAREIAQKYKIIVLERLDIKKLTESGKGTVEKPGKLVKLQALFNKELLRVGWYQFQFFLEEYAAKYGCQVEYVDPSYTTRTCNECGHVHDSQLGKRKFLCENCGLEMTSKVNAAKNILDRFLALSK